MQQDNPNVMACLVVAQMTFLSECSLSPSLCDRFFLLPKPLTISKHHTISTCPPVNDRPPSMRSIRFRFAALVERLQWTVFRELPRPAAVQPSFLPQNPRVPALVFASGPVCREATPPPNNPAKRRRASDALREESESQGFASESEEADDSEDPLAQLTSLSFAIKPERSGS